MSEFRTIRELCSVVVDCPHSTPKWTANGKIVIRNKNIKHGKIDFSSPSYTDDEHFAQRIKRAKPQPGDIIITREAPIGDVGMIPENTECCLGQRMVLLRANQSVCDNFYLLYSLQSLYVQHQISWSEGTGTTVSNLRIPHLEQIQIPYLPLEQQAKISSVLRALEEKIENNRRLNDNLQQQAAALFSSLYDRTNTEVRFTDLIQILGGGTPKTGENTYWNGNIAFFTPKDVGTPYTLITEKTITEEGLSHCNSRLYPVNTVFVTARGTVGKVGMSGVPMAMNQSCYALVGKETHQLLVYFYTLKAVDRLKHKASGAVFDAITTRDFESEQIMKLSDDDAKAFLCIAEPMFQKVLNNCIENLRLSTLRDSLLPKLMSGEVDVSAVQL
ncbi:MAG: restriction endonuclease subunit S [[Eubacterium] rectale]|jgi:type I restriction enzyme S subunit|nr:restriction endonuclease subunit S [Agathobacter rectalis]